MQQTFQSYIGDYFALNGNYRGFIVNYAEKYRYSETNHHTNPVKAGICVLPEDYKYSSARFYETGFCEWDFITHFRG